MVLLKNLSYRCQKKVKLRLEMLMQSELGSSLRPPVNQWISLLKRTFFCYQKSVCFLTDTCERDPNTTILKIAASSHLPCGEEFEAMPNAGTLGATACKGDCGTSLVVAAVFGPTVEYALSLKAVTQKAIEMNEIKIRVDVPVLDMNGQSAGILERGMLVRREAFAQAETGEGHLELPSGYELCYVYAHNLRRWIPRSALESDSAIDAPAGTLRRPLTVYFAGDLWTHKDLMGNALLACGIDAASGGRYECLLPQDLEEPINRSVDIRNFDLKHVMTCDLAIFNFDGANLDAGTVVEFIYAKMIDIPCVILRTDFRAAGEGGEDQDPWNLMAVGWPRTKVLKLHGMAEYQMARRSQLLATISELYRKMAELVVQALDVVRDEAPLVASRRLMEQVYSWAVLCPGAGYEKLFPPGAVEALLLRKMQHKLLA